MAAGVLAILGLGSVAPAEFMSHFIVFVLACFVGWQVVWNVTPACIPPYECNQCDQWNNCDWSDSAN